MTGTSVSPPSPAAKPTRNGPLPSARIFSEMKFQAAENPTQTKSEPARKRANRGARLNTAPTAPSLPWRARRAG
jgi:hypothetical protein